VREPLRAALRLVFPSLLAGLLIGAWVGAKCERAEWRRSRREGPRLERVVKRMSRDLELRSDQVEPVRRVLEARRPAFDAARREGDERLRLLRAETDRLLEPLLDDGQQRRLAQLRERRERRRTENAKP